MITRCLILSSECVWKLNRLRYNVNSRIKLKFLRTDSLERRLNWYAIARTVLVIRVRESTRVGDKKMR